MVARINPMKIDISTQLDSACACRHPRLAYPSAYDSIIAGLILPVIIVASVILIVGFVAVVTFGIAPLSRFPVVFIRVTIAIVPNHYPCGADFIRTRYRSRYPRCCKRSRCRRMIYIIRFTRAAD